MIQLHGLDASQVAVTLRALLVGEDQTKAENNNNGGGFGPGPFGFGRGGGRRFGGWFNQQPATTAEDANAGKFRVDADAGNNRLILWANKVELDQVEACLAELGEVGPRERGGENVRFLDLGNGSDQQQFLDRLRQVWPALGKDGNKLIIDVPPKKAEKEPDQRGSVEPQPAVEPKKEQAAPAQAPQAVPRVAPAGVTTKNDSHSDRSRETKTVAASVVPLTFTGPVGSSTVSPRLVLVAEQNSTAGPLLENNEPATKVQPAHRRGEQARRGATAAAVGPRYTTPDATGNNSDLRNAEKNVAGDPVYITCSPDGRLIIASRDGQALDALERLAARFGPSQGLCRLLHEAQHGGVGEI